MDKILYARLAWIYSIEEYKKTSEDSHPKKSDNKFIRLISKGDKDEFDPSYCKQIQRNELFSDSIIVDGCKLPVSVVKSDYKQYQDSLIHIHLEIDTASGISIETFARLIHGSSILNQTLVEKKSEIGAYLANKAITTNSQAFLINQISKTYPPLPENKQTDSDTFLKKNLQLITQMMLRSNTMPDGLSPQNHQELLTDISSFKGSIELCSGTTIVQFHFFNINSLGKSKVIDADTRFSWMCSVITMVNFQSLILKNATNEINELSPLDAKRKVDVTNGLKKILVELREYWDVDAMIHPMTARKINIYKDRLGVTNQFNSLNYRMESAEHLAIRELTEVQNEQDKILNYILLFIASVQLMPLVYKLMAKLSGHIPAEVEIFNFSATMFLSIFIPLLILKNRSIRKKIGSAFSSFK
ncbi:hypothetical protein JYT48_00140 [Mariprofundus ferrooxydans]|nr:hypothetical protein [Mariprofundus ferrooxydans]